MLIPPHLPQLLRTIDLALQSQNPARHRSLQQSRELQPFLENRAEEMLEAYGEGKNELIDGMIRLQQTQPGEDAAAWLRTRDLALWNQILAGFLEFQPPMEEEAITGSLRED